MSEVVNPKLKGSSIIDCIPQTSKWENKGSNVEMSNTIELPDYNVNVESYRVYKLVNKKSGRVYWVWKHDTDIFTCTCPVFAIHAIPCKHIKVILELEKKL